MISKPKMENLRSKGSSDDDFDQKSMKELSGNAATTTKMIMMMMHETSQQKLKSSQRGATREPVKFSQKALRMSATPPSISISVTNLNLVIADFAISKYTPEYGHRKYKIANLTKL